MKKILVIQTAFIGDAILASSLLESIHASDTRAEIHLLVRKGNESLYENHPFLKRVWVWNKSKKYSSLISLIKAIRKEKFQEVVNLQRFASSGIITALSGAKSTFGFSKNPLSFSFTEAFPHHINASDEEPALHEVERNYSMVKKRYRQFIPRPKLYPSQVQFQNVKSYQNIPYLTMSPSSVWFTKQWPKEKWEALIEKSEHHTYLLGAPSDRNYLESLAETNPEKTTVLAGELSLLESAALMKGALMNYVNDSAPMHLASAMNAPVTAIFCSTVPRFGFGPLSEESHIWQTKKNLPCRPCGLHGFKSCPEGHFKCADIKL